MTNNEPRFFQKRNFLKIFFLLIFAALFYSCEVLGEKPAEFLEDYGSVAYVENVDYSRESIEQGEWKNITSETDYTITYYINNPGNYKIRADFSFPDGFDGENSIAISDVDENRVFTGNSIAITFPQALLDAIDGDVAKYDISPSLALYRAEDDRPQSSYNINLRCNTPPAQITNAVSQMIETNQQLVIAFDMPTLANDVHLFTIEENGVKHNFNVVSGVPFAAGGESWTISASAPAGMVATHPDMPLFATQGGTPYYITTDITSITSRDVFMLTLTLTDRGGLTSNVQIPSCMLKLKPPTTSSVGSTGVLAQLADKDYGIFTMTVPDTSSATIHYTIEDTGVVFESGAAVGNATFYLYPKEDGTTRTYKVTQAYASLTGYLNSEDGADDMGSSGVITIEGSKLETPVSNGTTFTQNAEGYGEYVLTAESGATIFYTVKETGGAVIYNNLSGISPVKVKLPPGTFDVNATAVKKFHKDSAPLNETGVTVTATTIYVSASGSDSTGNGTKTKPYATIAKACSKFTNATSPLNTVYLLSDLDAPTNLAPATAYTAKIAGCKGGSVGSAVTIKCNTSGSAFNVANGNITLQNVNFAQSTGNTGSAISVAGGSLVLWNSTISGIAASDANGAVQVTSGTFTARGKVRITGNAGGDVYLANGKVINIDSSGIDGSLIGVKLQTPPTSSNPNVKITSGYGAKYGLASPSKYFTSNVGGVFTVNGGEAWISASTGGIGTNVPESLTFALSSSSGSGGAVTVRATGSVSGAITSGITWIITLRFGSENPLGVSTTNSITIPSSYPAGFYIIEVTAIYKGTTYSDSLTYTKN